ncbi:hypothetical protein [Streptomyces sp. NPDC021356]|uniref:hypothetical protein n=1 Tax=Streptomyces sp. NPDC021356 TaxID=3154900 RepID=UPI0033C70BD4
MQPLRPHRAQPRLLDQLAVGLLTVCIVVMLLEAYGRTNTLAEIDDMTAGYEQRGFLIPYPTVPSQ